MISICSRTVFLSLVLIGLMISTIPIVKTESIEPEREFVVSGPTWLEDYLFRREIELVGSAGAGTLYQVYVNVTYDSDIQTDFADVRFTDNDGTTELDHWREYYVNDTYAEFWVKVNDNLDSNRSIYMYYGNSTCSSASNGTNTFDFFDDFENNDLNRWDTAEANWATTGAQQRYGSYSAYGDADATERTLDWDLGFGLSGDFMVHAWVRFASDAGHEYPMYGYQGSQASQDIYPLGSSGDDWETYDGVAWQDYEADTQTAGTWLECEVAADFSNTYWRFYLDGVEKQEWALKDAAGNTITNIDRMGTITASVAGMDTWLDDYYIRKWVYSEPYVLQFGAEETGPYWQEVNTNEFVFPVEWDPSFTWGYNAAFVLGGLLLLPISMVYLVYGGREKMNTDKALIFLMMFMLGLGLFVGGIMP